MFSSDKNIDTISQLIVEIKRYVELRTEGLQIDFVTKMSRLFTAIILFAILFMLAALAVMFVSMTAAAALSSIIGSQAGAYALIVLAYVIIGVIVFINRRRWIEAPITHFIAALFLDNISQTPSSKKE